MRFLNFIILLGIVASAWAGAEYLGDLGQDKVSLKNAQQSKLIARLNVEANAGNIQSQYEFARLSIATDPLLAAKWMESAAQKSHIKAQFYFAQMHEAGNGVKQDIRAAVLWYKRAAQFGNDEQAQYALGRLYNTGVGVGHDTNESIIWFRHAAKGGHPAAQFMVGRMFETGWGGKKDLIHSFAWYSLSNRSRMKALDLAPGNDPQKALQRIEKQMNDSQRDRAKIMLKHGLPFK